MGTMMMPHRKRSWWRVGTGALALSAFVASMTQADVVGRAVGAGTLALQDVSLSAEDLPLDADGRSAADGRLILGIVRQNIAPPELVAEQERLTAERAAIATVQVEDARAVRTDIRYESLPARIDSGDTVLGLAASTTAAALSVR